MIFFAAVPCKLPKPFLEEIGRADAADTLWQGAYYKVSEQEISGRKKLIASSSRWIEKTRFSQVKDRPRFTSQPSDPLGLILLLDGADSVVCSTINEDPSESSFEVSNQITENYGSSFFSSVS